MAHTMSQAARNRISLAMKRSWAQRHKLGMGREGSVPNGNSTRVKRKYTRHNLVQNNHVPHTIETGNVLVKTYRIKAFHAILRDGLDHPNTAVSATFEELITVFDDLFPRS